MENNCIFAHMTGMNIAVIGGGAAGFFAALSCRQHHPAARITIYEKSGKLLAKVKISGGGRCNVTHACFQNSKLIKHYPRGEKALKKVFAQFTTTDTIQWYKSRGVQLKAEEDGRMFPITDDSQTIIDTLMNQVRKAGIDIRLNQGIRAMSRHHEGWQLELSNGQSINADRVIIATGSSPSMKGFNWLAELRHEIVPPVPSLFTFNMPGNDITALMGLVAPLVEATIQGTKVSAEGPLLITHWGMSGPAILKLSAWAARYLNEQEYRFVVRINWWEGAREDVVREELNQVRSQYGKRKLVGHNPGKLPRRLWAYLLSRSGVPEAQLWGELSKKNFNRLINVLVNDEHEVRGKTTFKEEFVTCGGVALKDIDMTTMESKVAPGLYFAGEVLDIDGVTGGFNFQAAWSTGYVAGQLK